MSTPAQQLIYVADTHRIDNLAASLIKVCESARNIAGLLEKATGRAPARALAQQLTRALDPIAENLSDLSSLTRDNIIVPVLDTTRLYALELDVAVAGDVSAVRKPVADLLSAIRNALDLARQSNTQRYNSTDRQSAGARRLLAAAAWMLPSVDRARYGEEFASELAEIALAGGGRFKQLAYAARQAMSAMRLRAALKFPRQRGALP